MGLFADLIGTTKAAFQIAIGGVKLGNSTGNLTVKDNAGADSDVTVKKAFLSGDELEINSDAAGADADWKYTLKRPATGMTAAVELTLPPNDGSPNQVIATDGNGVLTFVTAGVTIQNISVDETVIAFDTSSPAAMFNLPVGAVPELVRVILDTPFTKGVDVISPTLSIGIAGTVSKYMATTQVDLKGAAGDVYECKPSTVAITGSPEAVIATLAGNGATAGSARVEFHYATPS